MSGPPRCPKCGASLLEPESDGRKCANGHWLPGRTPATAAIGGHTGHSGQTPYTSVVATVKPPGANGRVPTPRAGPVAVGILLSDVQPEEVRWLWRQRLPLGKLALVDGDPGLGKSTMLLDLAARVTRGDAMPDGSDPDVSGPAGVVLVQAEDGLADTIVPRFLAAGGVRERIVAFTAVSEPAEYDGEGHERRPARTRLPHLGDAEQLEDMIRRVSARLVIVDPLVAFLPPRVDANKDAEVRQGLSAVVDLAERLGCVVAGIRHLNKAAALSALYRGGGSIGIIGAARSGLLVAGDPSDPRRRVLAPLKSNLAPLAPSMAWSLESAAGGVAIVRWEGISDLTAAHLLEGGDKEERSAGSEAEEFLRSELAEGERPAEELMSTARRLGIAARTLRRAAEGLGVRKRRRGFGKGSEMRWSLAIHEAVALNAAMRGAGSPPPLPERNGSVFESGEGVSGSAVEPLRVTCPKCGEPLGLDGTCALCDGVI
jgi:hypothetical protein